MNGREREREHTLGKIFHNCSLSNVRIQTPNLRIMGRVFYHCATDVQQSKVLSAQVVMNLTIEKILLNCRNIDF